MSESESLPGKEGGTALLARIHRWNRWLLALAVPLSFGVLSWRNALSFSTGMLVCALNVFALERIVRAALKPAGSGALISRVFVKYGLLGLVVLGLLISGSVDAIWFAAGYTVAMATVGATAWTARDAKEPGSE